MGTWRPLRSIPRTWGRCIPWAAVVLCGAALRAAAVLLAGSYPCSHSSCVWQCSVCGWVGSILCLDVLLGMLRPEEWFLFLSPRLGAQLLAQADPHGTSITWHSPCCWLLLSREGDTSPSPGSVPKGLQQDGGTAAPGPGWGCSIQHGAEDLRSKKQREGSE